MKIKRILVVGVILLFIGVAVVPSINFNVVKAASDNDLIEVTSQACGIKGYGNTTVKLTGEQYKNLEQYLVEFRARLNRTTTREEAVPLFKEAVVNLNTYGLLPQGMSVEQAQDLILSRIHNEVPSLSLKHPPVPPSCSLGVSQSRNILCLITGEGTNTFFQTLLNTLVIKTINLFINTPLYSIYAVCLAIGIISMYYWNMQWPLINLLLYLDSSLLQVIQDMFISLTTYTGVSAFDVIRYCPYVINGQYQSTGWMHTIGLLGHQAMNGTFRGRFPHWPLGFFQFLGNPGVIGFTGIRINTDPTSHQSFYLGSALLVAVDVTTP
ncbi:MAG: hypothetical protein JXA00_03180 [Candidatus Thermoplasmatota archaeon]|nr:hypothetical protein [Candidatus Thermoplasmatota archaeon]